VTVCVQRNASDRHSRDNKELRATRVRVRLKVTCGETRASDIVRRKSTHFTHRMSGLRKRATNAGHDDEQHQREQTRQVQEQQQQQQPPPQSMSWRQCGVLALVRERRARFAIFAVARSCAPTPPQRTAAIMFVFSLLHMAFQTLFIERMFGSARSGIKSDDELRAMVCVRCVVSRRQRQRALAPQGRRMSD
jgi:hypothetical protein